MVQGLNHPTFLSHGCNQKQLFVTLNRTNKHIISSSVKQCGAAVGFGHSLNRNAIKLHTRASSYNQDEFPTANDKTSNTIEASEPTSDDEQQSTQKNFLQKIAISFASFISYIFPPALRKAFAASSYLRILWIFGFGVGMILVSFLSGPSLIGSRSAPATTARSTLPREVIYSDFLRFVQSGNVGSVRFEDGTGRILFDLKPHSTAITHMAPPQQGSSTVSSRKASPTVYASRDQALSATADISVTPTMAASSAITYDARVKPTPRQFYTRHVPDPQLITTLSTAGVEFGTVRRSMSASLLRAFATVCALWIPLLPMFFVMKRMLDGRSGGKKKRGKGAKSKSPPITFADVAGIGPAKEELKEVVACLKDSSRFAQLGAKLPSGVLLVGPPGTGKTLLAKAVAGEAGVPFLAVSASEFVELFVGRGAARIRELFQEARKLAPCVVFVDELDAVGGKRGAGYNEERDQTLNQLLTELDGFEGRPGVVLLAATNREEVLDPALLRPGRLSRKIKVPLPDEEGRAAIMQVHLRNVPLSGGAEAVPQAAGVIAKLSSGCSGAELANVVNEAAFLAARRQGATTIELVDLVEAVSRTRFGVKGGNGEGLSWWTKAVSWALVSDGGRGGGGGSRKVMRTQPMGGS